MGDIHKSYYTVAIPDGAMINNDVVSWTDARGKKKTGKLTKNKRVIVETNKWIARYKDEHGNLHQEATGCKSKDMALAYLRNKELEIERIKAGVATRKEINASVQSAVSIEKHIQAFRTHMQSKGNVKEHINQTIKHIETIVEFIGAKNITDIRQEKIELWIVTQIQKGLTHRTVNSYVASCKTFLTWCIDTSRIDSNPLKKIKKLNEAITRKKQRRALSEDELKKLFEAARLRKRRKNKNGNEIELIYRTLVGTGFRLKELKSIKVFQVDFERNEITLKAVNEKRKKGTQQPINADLSKRLKKWTSMKLPKDNLFEFTKDQLRTSFENDCKLAGIKKVLDDGRSVDLHCLRKTFGTMLARAGVPITTTQRLMRHSTVELTSKIYIDVDPIDISNALKKLPKID